MKMMNKIFFNDKRENSIKKLVKTLMKVDDIFTKKMNFYRK